MSDAERRMAELIPDEGGNVHFTKPELLRFLGLDEASIAASEQRRAKVQAMLTELHARLDDLRSA